MMVTVFGTYMCVRAEKNIDVNSIISTSLSTKEKQVCVNLPCKCGSSEGNIMT